MTELTTLSRRRTRRFWGWGYDDAALSEGERTQLDRLLTPLGTRFVDAPAPQLSEFDLPAPRVTPPKALATRFSATPLDRLNHAGGKSYADVARMWLRQPPVLPDWVAFADHEQDIADILDWAQAANVAVIPYGGGSSVCGGVEAAVGKSYAGAISLDMERLNRVLEVDPVSRAARIQAGALGPELEAQLKPHGLTLRHFPQSFEFSTLAAGSSRAPAATTPPSTPTSTSSSNRSAWSRRPARCRRAACRHRVPAPRPSAWCSAPRARSAWSPKPGCGCRHRRASGPRRCCSSRTTGRPPNACAPWRNRA